MKQMQSTFVAQVAVTDPDTGLSVWVEVRKLENGAMVGFDEAFLAQLAPGENPLSPYDPNTVIVVREDEEGGDV